MGRLRFKSRRRGASWRYAVAALLLLPFWIGLLWAAWEQLRDLAGHRLTWLPAVAGAAAYLAVQFVFRRPMRVYVFGHEMTHALAAWLSGFRVKSMRVSATGGEVVLSGSNAAVALAPYCVPLYTFLAVAGFAGAKAFAQAAIPAFWFPFAVGATFAFHVALTVHALAQDQPDLLHAGVFPSLVFILFANAVVLVLLLKVLFPATVSLRDFAAEFFTASFLAWDHVLRAAAWTAAQAGGAAQRLWTAAR